MYSPDSHVANYILAALIAKMGELPALKSRNLQNKLALYMMNHTGWLDFYLTNPDTEDGEVGISTEYSPKVFAHVLDVIINREYMGTRIDVYPQATNATP